MRLIRLQRYLGMAIKIVKYDNLPSFPYSFRLKPPKIWQGRENVRTNGWRYDSTSHQSVGAALAAAKEEAVWFHTNKPRRNK